MSNTGGTGGEGGVEYQLDDKFFVESGPQSSLRPTGELDSEGASLSASGVSPEDLQKLGDPWSLPAALCDHTLISEIQAIPNKMGFKIGEVADLLGIKQYVLRYWESEFDLLKPKKAQNNQRYYTRKDVENVLLVRKLLHRDRFSIEGARAALKGLRQQVKKEKDWLTLHDRIDRILQQTHDLKAQISQVQHLLD